MRYFGTALTRLLYSTGIMLPPFKMRNIQILIEFFCGNSGSRNVPDSPIQISPCFQQLTNGKASAIFRGGVLRGRLRYIRWVSLGQTHRTFRGRQARGAPLRVAIFDHKFLTTRLMYFGAARREQPFFIPAGPFRSPPRSARFRSREHPPLTPNRSTYAPARHSHPGTRESLPTTH